ncbi:unnamed protein product, partial [Ixodes persulcatus]
PEVTWTFRDVIVVVASSASSSQPTFPSGTDGTFARSTRSPGVPFARAAGSPCFCRVASPQCGPRARCSGSEVVRRRNGHHASVRYCVRRSGDIRRSKDYARSTTKLGHAEQDAENQRAFAGSG